MAALETSSDDMILSELPTLPADEPSKREACSRCKRPLRVCICDCFPPTPLSTHTSIIILQHPHEESRSLATVPLLKQCLSPDKFLVIRGKKFSSSKNEVLQTALGSPNTYLLFPSDKAVDVQSLPPARHHDTPPTVIVLDGTWAQAKGMYHHNPQFKRLTQIVLAGNTVSEYVIRTQPTHNCLSTLECVAHTLAWLEESPDIIECLVRPLRTLCQYQLDHGAVVHLSKDHPDYISPWMLKLQSASSDKEKEKKQEQNRT